MVYLALHKCFSFLFLFFNLFFNFTILYWFCHISTWIRHRYTHVPHPEPSSLPIPSLWVVPVHQLQASSFVHRTWTGNSPHTWYYTCFNATLKFSSAAVFYYIWIFKSESLSTHPSHNGIHLCTCLLFVWFKLELKPIWSLFFCIMWGINIILFFSNWLSSYSTSFFIKKSIFIPMICYIYIQ